jgi:Tfp pilus assembly protein PilO
MAEDKSVKINKTFSGKQAIALLMRYFNFVPPVLFLLILIIGYSFLLKPKYDNIKNEIEVTIKNKEEQRANYENYFQRLKNLKGLLREVTAADLGKLDRMIPSGPESEKLMVDLEAIIKGRGLFLSGLSVEDGTKEPAAPTSDQPNGLPEGIRQSAVSISIAGANYDAFKKLLVDMENYVRLLDITGLTFNPSGKTMNLELTAYYLAE